MYDDLTEIEKEIQARKQAEETPPAVPVISFDKPAEMREKQTATDKTAELVEGAFHQAVVHRVSTDENMQKTLLDSAEKVIKNKTDAIRERADLEDKTAYFRNKKGACECFGYNEETTEKWAVKVMNFWHNIMTAIWLFIGFFTFAPITFIAKKITVIFKKTWLAILVSIILYLIIVVGLPILASYLNLQQYERG